MKFDIEKALNGAPIVTILEGLEVTNFQGSRSNAGPFKYKGMIDYIWYYFDILGKSELAPKFDIMLKDEVKPTKSELPASELTIRDQMALSIMQSLVQKTNNDISSYSYMTVESLGASLASEAYKYADALIAASNKSNEQS